MNNNTYDFYLLPAIVVHSDKDCKTIRLGWLSFYIEFKFNKI